MRDLADKITWIVIADGEKAMIFVNDDTPEQPFLNILSKNELDNPPTREQAANRPGRFNDPGAQGAQRSAVQDTDWHQFEKDRFAKDFAEAINLAAKKNAFDELVLFAPPHALGVLRPELHKETADRLVFDVDSDLTNHSVDDIEKHLANAYKEHRREQAPST
ncbi:MAG: host attachment family protein [Pseudomonadota bacterium]